MPLDTQLAPQAVFSLFYPTVFRYFDAIGRIGDFGFFDETPKLRAYCQTPSERGSVRETVVESFSDDLMTVPRRRGPRISARIEAAMRSKAA